MGRSPSPARRRKDKHRDRIKHRKRSKSREKSLSRSRSPVERRRKERRYSRSPIERSRRATRSRSRSYERERRRSPVPSSSHKSSKVSRATSSKKDFEGPQSVDEQEMMKTMGFTGFSTTKGKKVEGNDVGEVHVILKRKYRQYMNRKGGFNRPLDFVA
uniref:U4/U6.U5 small nuclear ribonucleoprotein 27 kDa protein n=1 Tax=Culicoides sonorensis TaxID=179676 RepID=A0A336KUR6_CULSO